METKKIGDATGVTTVNAGDKLIGVNSAGAMQKIAPADMVASLNKVAAENTAPSSELFVKLCDANGKEYKVSVGDLAKSVMRVMAVSRISKSDIINDLKSTGVYLVVSGDSPAGLPSQSSGILHVVAFNGVEVIQHFTSLNNKTYSRMFHVNTWYDWK